MTVSVTQVVTKNASQFVERLAAEWWQDVPRTSLDKGHILIPLEIGTCEMSADGNMLEITITAPSVTDAAYLEAAVSEFLDRVAGNEELHYQWTVQPEISEQHNTLPARGKFSWSELTSIGRINF
jgi:hypothetical protein